jgi:hypothetical protein
MRCPAAADRKTVDDDIAARESLSRSTDFPDGSVNA